jgi:hypothetical protein
MISTSTPSRHSASGGAEEQAVNETIMIKRVMYKAFCIFIIPIYVYFFLRSKIPQMKKANSTMVDTIVTASKLPLINAGILLSIRRPKTTSTALI